MAEQSLEEYLGDVLNFRIPGIPKLEEYPSYWRKTPPEASDSNDRGYPAWWPWLAMYIDLADTKPWAREGLRGLLRELLEKGEPVPGMLISWAVHQFAWGEPAPRRGRPEDSERNVRVLVVFMWLQIEGYHRDEAMGVIADQMVCDPETVRSIIRKFEKHPPFR